MHVIYIPFNLSELAPYVRPRLLDRKHRLLNMCIQDTWSNRSMYAGLSCSSLGLPTLETSLNRHSRHIKSDIL